MKVMIDTMIHDALAADAGARSRLERLVADGAIVLLTTHIQQDQLADIRDDEKRHLATSIPTTKIGTSAAVWDLSKWDEAEWGTDEANAMTDALAGTNPKELPDALIGVTAASSADLLVTNDRRLTKRLHKAVPALQVMNFREFDSFRGSWRALKSYDPR